MFRFFYLSEFTTVIRQFIPIVYILFLSVVYYAVTVKGGKMQKKSWAVAWREAQLFGILRVNPFV